MAAAAAPGTLRGGSDRASDPRLGGLRYIASNEHPDHDTIAAFRKRFLPQIESLFIEVLKLARMLGMLKLGTVALDGTKIHATRAGTALCPTGMRRRSRSS